VIRPRFKGDPAEEARRRMIAQTSAFLTWALAQPDMPRIPTRLVSAGGFAFLRYEPAARARVAQWWSHVLDMGSPDEAEGFVG